MEVADWLTKVAQPTAIRSDYSTNGNFSSFFRTKQSVNAIRRLASGYSSRNSCRQIRHLNKRHFLLPPGYRAWGKAAGFKRIGWGAGSAASR
ncbi:hypothetical protein GCM10027578_25790 [Spirosoma luteolum]